MAKFILYAVLIFIAWQFVRRFLAGLAPPAQRQAPDRRDRPAEPAPTIEAQDLVRCAVCGSYVAARCTRTNCPQ